MSFIRVMTEHDIPAVIKKIDGFASLSIGWHYGSGGPIVGNVSETAKHLYSYATSIGFTRSNVFAGRDREILLSVYNAKCHIDIHVEPDGTFSFVEEWSDGSRRDFEYGEIQAVVSHLLRLAKVLCNTSGSFIQMTTIKNAVSSMIWHSNRRQTAVGCRL